MLAIHLRYHGFTINIWKKPPLISPGKKKNHVGFPRQLSSDRFGLFGSSSVFTIHFKILNCVINDWLKYNLLGLPFIVSAAENMIIPLKELLRELSMLQRELNSSFPEKIFFFPNYLLSFFSFSLEGKITLSISVRYHNPGKYCCTLDVIRIKYTFSSLLILVQIVTYLWKHKY